MKSFILLKQNRIYAIPANILLFNYCNTFEDKQLLFIRYIDYFPIKFTLILYIVPSFDKRKKLCYNTIARHYTLSNVNLIFLII